MPISAQHKLFGHDGDLLLNAIAETIDFLTMHQTRYTCLNNEAFNALLEQDPDSGLMIYWQETLGRAHFAAVSSLIRSHRWCSGMKASYDAKLFLPYCANFRALIESVADTYYALNNIAITLAENRALINKALLKQSSAFVVSKDLEDQLIHFAYGRKLKKGEEAPASHAAKSAYDYIKSLDGSGIPNLYEIYGDLCQFTHPAAHSVSYLCIPDTEESYVFSGQYEDIRIEAFAKKHWEIMSLLLMYGFNPSILTLKVLLYIEAPEFHSPPVRKIDLSSIKTWEKCRILMGATS